MVDEAHERSLNTDILMGLLKKIQQRRRKLKVIISSATMDAEKIKHFFDDRPGSQTRDSSIILNITGRKFPVDIFYLKSGARNYIEAAVNTALEIHKSELGVRGDILAFFPGSYEIDKAIAIAAENYLGSDLIMMPFHSSLPTSTQMQVFQSMPIGHRKFICATNIAETSLTIEEIKYVIDTGFVNLNFFDVKTGIDMLVTTSISKASARQRAGRCGRTEAGKCFRLMTEVSYNSLPSQTIPEIQRTDISWSILQLKALGIQDVIHFDFVSSPAVDKVIYALELLYCLGALDLQGNLTSDGEKMSEMAISPQLSKTLLMSYEYGCGEEILTIASMCSVEYPFITLHHQTNREKRQKIDESLKTFVSLDGDHFTYLNLYQEYVSNNYSRQWCDSNFVLFKILERAREVRLNLKQLITHFGPPGGVISSCVGDTDSIKKCMLTGLFTNIARLGNDGKYHTLKGNAEVNLHPTTVYAVFGTPPNWVMYNQLVQSLVPQMRDVSSVQPLWIYETANHFYQLTNFSNYKV
jgi:ATP-dependent RNA helicase DDX35